MMLGSIWRTLTNYLQVVCLVHGSLIVSCYTMVVNLDQSDRFISVDKSLIYHTLPFPLRILRVEC